MGKDKTRARVTFYRGKQRIRKESEVEEVDLIRKIKKKNRKNMICVFIGIALAAFIIW